MNILVRLVGGQQSLIGRAAGSRTQLMGDQVPAVDEPRATGRGMPMPLSLMAPSTGQAKAQWAIRSALGGGRAQLSLACSVIADERWDIVSACANQGPDKSMGETASCSPPHSCFCLRYW